MTWFKWPRSYLSSQEIKFDKHAAREAALKFDDRITAQPYEGYTDKFSFQAGAEWQFEQDKVRIAALEAKLKEAEELNDKLKRLFNGEKVTMVCVDPSHSASVKLDKRCTCGVSSSGSPPSLFGKCTACGGWRND